MLTPRQIAILRLIHLMPGAGRYSLGITDRDVIPLIPDYVTQAYPEGLYLSQRGYALLQSLKLETFGREVPDHAEKLFAELLQNAKASSCADVRNPYEELLFRNKGAAECPAS